MRDPGAGRLAGTYRQYLVVSASSLLHSKLRAPERPIYSLVHHTHADNILFH